MFKKVFLIILGLNILVFSVSISYKIINRLNNKYSYKQELINKHNLSNNISNNFVIDALTLIAKDDYNLIKDLLDNWDYDIKLYDENKRNQVQYIVLAFTNNKDINKFIKKLNSLGFKANLINNNINLGIFNTKEEAQTLKQKLISYDIDVGIMKISNTYNDGIVDENKYIIYFSKINYYDFYEITKILESFSILEPIIILD